MLIETCFDLRYAPEGMTDEENWTWRGSAPPPTSPRC